MKNTNQSRQWISLTSGILVASITLVLMSDGLVMASHAATPTTQKVMPTVTELKAKKDTSAIDYESEFAQLNMAESQYAESMDQQTRLKSATKRMASGKVNKKSKLNRKR